MEKRKTLRTQEADAHRQRSLFEFPDFSQPEENASKESAPTPTCLQPIVKWPGGKEKELKYILPHTPGFERFFEPFVGGGSVFTAMQAREYYINDLSEELTSLYRHIATTDAPFFRYAEMMDASWERALAFFRANPLLTKTYLDYRRAAITKEELKTFVRQFCQAERDGILRIIGEELAARPCVLVDEMGINLFRKMTRMRCLEEEKHVLPYDDVLDNLETAVKSAVYMNYRHLYNDKDTALQDPALHCALFLFMRNYAYSGMFRYSSKGEFNVPYGGIAYNRKLMAKKLNYYRSAPLLARFANTRIYNLDFEDFLRKTKPAENDFVFVDPPYDTEFSTYAQNAFTRADQQRLARYLINECRAKWMLIIKNTDFIFGLYDQKDIHISTFDKEYLVSFMNRNNKKVTHLLITNYETSAI